MLSSQPPEAEALIRFFICLHAGKETGGRPIGAGCLRLSPDCSKERIPVAEAAGILGIAPFIDATGHILARTWSGVSLSPVPMLQHVTSDPRKRLTRRL